MSQPETLGPAFARALAAKNPDGIREVLHPEIDFRGLTPNRSWEATGPDEVIALLLGDWFEDDDEVESLDKLESDAFSDRERVGYRVTLSNPEGRFLVEQQAYLEVRDDRIAWMRVVCAGYRPAEG